MRMHELNADGFALSIDECIREASDDIIMAKGCSNEIGVAVGVIIVVECLIVTIGITIIVVLWFWR